MTVNTDWVPLYNQISFSPDLLGHKLTGIVDEDYGNMYAAEAGRLHYFYFSPYTWSIYESYDLAGYQINGLSKGDPNLNALYSNYYLNTDNGILPFQRSEGWYFDEAFGAGLGGSRDIRGSASFPIIGTDVDYAVFFRRPGGLGGTYVPYGDTGNPSSWSWLNQNVDGVSDMTVSRYNAYYAADGDVFAIAPAYLQNPTLAENRIDLSVPARPVAGVSAVHLGRRRRHLVSGHDGWGVADECRRIYHLSICQPGPGARASCREPRATASRGSPSTATPPTMKPTFPATTCTS